MKEISVEDRKKIENAIRKGDNRGLEYQFHKYFYDELRTSLVRAWGGRESCAGFDIEDVLSKTFEQAFRDFRSLESEQAFFGWLRRIGLNRLLDFIRRENAKRRKAPYETTKAGNISELAIREAIEIVAAPELTPSREMMNHEVKEIIGVAIGNMSQMQRNTIELFYFENMPIKEIAETLGISDGAVRGHLQRGRKTLRESLEEFSLSFCN